MHVRRIRTVESSRYSPGARLLPVGPSNTPQFKTWIMLGRS
jgi:hypothetical protein